MKDRMPLLAMFALFISVQVVALVLVPLYPSDYQAFPDSNNPVNPLIYIVMVLAMTGLVLLLIKIGLGRIIKVIFLTAVAISSVFVLLPIVYQAVPDFNWAMVISIIISGLLIAALLLRPEWYVVNTVGFIVGCGAAIILGLSLGILPVLILLVALAIYDAISVYKTKHMIALAEGVVPLRLPVVFVIPKSKDFTMDSLADKPLTEEPPEERGAMFMGVGDAVIPSVLTVSSFVFLPAVSGSFDHANLLVSIGVIIGSTLGFMVLMRYVMKGNPQAGLPLLNGGAILGFMVMYLLVFQNLSFGIVL
jgi:presenilin-like A22 family membrane protease